MRSARLMVLSLGGFCMHSSSWCRHRAVLRSKLLLQSLAGGAAAGGEPARDSPPPHPGDFGAGAAVGACVADNTSTRDEAEAARLSAEASIPVVFLTSTIDYIWWPESMSESAFFFRKEHSCCPTTGTAGAGGSAAGGYRPPRTAG